MFFPGSIIYSLGDTRPGCAARHSGTHVRTKDRSCRRIDCFSPFRSRRIRRALPVVGTPGAARASWPNNGCKTGRDSPTRSPTRTWDSFSLLRLSAKMPVTATVFCAESVGITERITKATNSARMSFLMSFLYKKTTSKRAGHCFECG